MTEEMLRDFIKVLRRRNTILVALIIALSVALACVSVIAFSEFTIVVENEETTTYFVEQTAEITGNDNTVTQGSTDIVILDSKYKNIAVIIAGMILTVILTFLGVKYVENKNKNYYYKKKVKKDNDNEEA